MDIVYAYLMEIEFFTSLMMTHIFFKVSNKFAQRSFGVLKQNTILRAEVVRRFTGVLKQKYYTPGGGPPEF